MPKVVLAQQAALVAGSLAVVLLALEMGLRLTLGLGNPVLYESNPLYGFRPRPDQEVTRFGGARIRINNLGLRADSDWDSNIEDKVLFLGDSVTYGGSYIDNRELFSTIAVENLAGFQSGNGGVNAWGVENIHGLVVDAGFLPARTYVTVVLESDFNRGTTRLQGLPYWSRKPGSAIAELVHYALYRWNNRRFVPWREDASAAIEQRVVARGARKLRHMDDFLAAEGYRHLLYISPTAEQLFGDEVRDGTVHQALDAVGLEPVYLVDRVRSRAVALSRDEVFYDRVHLNRAGHRLWAEIIGEDLTKIVARR